MRELPKRIMPVHVMALCSLSVTIGIALAFIIMFLARIDSISP